MIAMALAGTDAIPRWRSLMGPTKVYKYVNQINLSWNIRSGNISGLFSAGVSVSTAFQEKKPVVYKWLSL